MEISAKDVKALRDATGAGMMDCKEALAATNGDFEKAVVWLREKGIASSAKREDRAAKEGAIVSYIHMNGKYGVLAEINCETDFVARGEPFQTLCRDLCLHICSANPKWVKQEDVPAEAVEAELEIYRKQAAETGKPPQVCEKIAQGKLSKWYQQVCLLDQPSVKDPNMTVDQLIRELSGKVGEKIAVRRFVRWERGESL